LVIMHEAATTKVHPNNTNNVNGTSIPQSKNLGKTNRHHPSTIRENNGDPKGMGKPRQNYYNRQQQQQQNNNNNSVGSSPDLKNPKPGKRYNRNKMSGGPSDSVAPIRQGGGDHHDNRPISFPSSSPINQSLSSSSSLVRGQPSNSSVKSWSNIVSSSYSQNGYSQETQSPPPHKPQPIEPPHVPSHENNNNSNKRSNRSKKPNNNNNRFEEKSAISHKNNNNNSTTHNNNNNKSEETEFNADAKIEAIQLQLDKTLNDMQTKADLLKNLQEEIKSIKLERDGKIDELNTERANLIDQLDKLKTELSETENQISNISATMGQLKMNKIQKIRSLEEHSRALLNDRAI